MKDWGIEDLVLTPRLPEVANRDEVVVAVSELAGMVLPRMFTDEYLFDHAWTKPSSHDKKTKHLTLMPPNVVAWFSHHLRCQPQWTKNGYAREAADEVIERGCKRRLYHVRDAFYKRERRRREREAAAAAGETPEAKTNARK